MSKPMMKALYYSSVRYLRRASRSPLTPVISYLQAKNFTIKEVPIPEVKDDEILLKGVVLSSFPRGSWTSVFMWLSVDSYLLWRLWSP